LVDSPQSGSRSVLKTFVIYLCAATLPICAAQIVAASPALHGIPFALNFTVVAAIAALAGPGPAITSIIVSIVTFNLLAPHSSPSFDLGRLQRTVVLLAAAFFVAYLSWKQRAGENKLRLTLESLQERNHALTQAQQGSDLATWVFYPDSMKTYWDEGSREVFGRPFADLGGRAIPMEFIHPEDQEQLRESVIAAISIGEPLRVEYRVIWPNGAVHWLEGRGTQVSTSPNIWRGATFDITRRKLVEAALIRSEKLAAMGRLASTIAHEVNNPLESVTNLLYLINSDEALTPTTRSYITLAEEELARLSNITRLTLTFARSASVRVPTSLSDVLDAVLSIYQRRCDLLNVTIERCYTPGLTVEMPPHELRQIVINLVANALDALTEQRPLLRLHTLPHGDRVVVRVEDSGSGIDILDQNRVFDAFFTTKSDVGTGIGLWVTKELVEKNGGTITVESGELGEGIRTRFRVEFPASSVAEAASAVAASAVIDTTPTLPEIS
jgi:PAS domain S-box-containing protein